MVMISRPQTRHKPTILLSSKGLDCVKLVMRRTKQSQISQIGGRPALSERDSVVDLESIRAQAASSVKNVGTLPPVSSPDRASHCGGYGSPRDDRPRALRL